MHIIVNAFKALYMVGHIHYVPLCTCVRLCTFPLMYSCSGCAHARVCTCSGCAHARGGSGARGMRATGWRIDPRGERGRLLIAELADGAASLAVQDCAVCRGHTTVLCVTCDLCHLIIVCPCLAPAGTRDLLPHAGLCAEDEVWPVSAVT